MKANMKAINSNFLIAEVPIPTPKTNEALVRVYSFGITYNDLRLRDVLPERELGIEFSGKIESLGDSDQAGFRIGQSVYGLAISGGAFAEYVICPLDTLCPMPRGMSFTAAASIADMWFSALQILKHDVEMKKRDTIIVYNAMCTVGQSTLELAQILGCRRLFAVVNTADAVDAVGKALTFHTALPDEVIPLHKTVHIEKEVARYGDSGLAAAVDLRARPDLSQDIRLLKEDGRLAFTSVAPALTERDLTSIVYKRLRLHGVTFLARPPQFYKENRDFIVKHINPKFLNGQLKVRLARTYDWKEIEKAFDFLARNREALGKVVCNIVSAS